MARLRRDIRQMTEELRAAGREASQGFGAGVTALNQGAELAGKLLRGIGAGARFAVAGMLALTVAAADYQTAQAEIQTIADRSVFTTERIHDLNMELAKQYGSSINTNAKALYQTISAGVTDAAGATDLLRSANVLAVGGLTDVKTAVDTLTSTVNAYAAENLTAKSASESMFVAIRAGKTTAEELASQLGQVTGLAAQAGISFDEVTASVAAMTTQGIKTETSVIQLRQVIASIISPSGSAAAEARRLGVDFSIAGLKANGLKGTLDAIINSAKFTDESMSRLFGNVRALSGALALTTNNGAKLAETMEQMANKADADVVAFQRMTETLNFQIDRAETLGEALKITLGTAVSESENARRGMKALSAVFEQFIGFAEGKRGREAINAFMGSIISGVQSTIGVVSVFFKTLGALGSDAAATLGAEFEAAIATIEKQKAGGGNLVDDFTKEVAKANVDAVREILSIQEMFANGALQITDSLGLEVAKRMASLQNQIEANREMYRQRRGHVTDLIKAEQDYAREITKTTEKLNDQKKAAAPPPLEEDDGPQRPGRARGRILGRRLNTGDDSGGGQVRVIRKRKMSRDEVNDLRESMGFPSLDSFEEYWNELGDKTQEGLGQLHDRFTDFGAMLTDTLGSAIEGFSSLVAESLTNLILGVDEAGKSFSEKLGDMIVALGTQLIQMGIAATIMGALSFIPGMQFLTGPPGAGLVAGGIAIAAGTGMVALGGALGGGKSSSSGGGAPATGTGGGAGFGAESSTPTPSALRFRGDDGSRPDGFGGAPAASITNNYNFSLNNSPMVGTKAGLGRVVRDALREDDRLRGRRGDPGGA